MTTIKQRLARLERKAAENITFIVNVLDYDPTPEQITEWEKAGHIVVKVGGEDDD